MNQTSYVQFFYCTRSIPWELIPLPRRFEPAVRPHHRAQRRDNLGASFCQWLPSLSSPGRVTIGWRFSHMVPITRWPRSTVHSTPTRQCHLITPLRTALPQSYLRYTFLPARPRVNEVSKSSPYPVTTVPITSADSSAFDSTVSGTWTWYCKERWVFRRIVGVLFDNIVTCHCCDYSKKEMSSPVVRDLPCIHVVCLYFLDVQLNLS